MEENERKGKEKEQNWRLEVVSTYLAESAHTLCESHFLKRHPSAQSETYPSCSINVSLTTALPTSSLLVLLLLCYSFIQNAALLHLHLPFS